MRKTTRESFYLYLLLSILLFLAGCTTEPLQSTDQEEEIIPVRVEQLTVGPFVHTVELSGRTKAIHDFPVISPTPLNVKEIYVQVGQEVAKGAPLLQFDDQDARVQLEEAKDQVRRLEKTMHEAKQAQQQLSDEAIARQKGQEEALKRAQAVVEGAQTGAVTMLDLLQASTELMLLQSQLQGLPALSSSNLTQLELQLEQARSQVRAAERAVEAYTVTAPFSGTVTARYVEPNGMAIPNNPLLQVSDLSHILVDLQVSANHIRQLQQGMNVKVQLEGDPEAFEAKLDTLSPGTGSQGTFQAQIRLDNPERTLFPGKLAKVFVETYSIPEATLVPVQAVFTQEENQYVYTVNTDKIASLQKVQLGERNQSYYVVESGLSPTDTVIIAGKDRVTDGSKVYTEVSERR